MGHNMVKAIVLAAVVAVVCVRPALAYIDPNTGGQLFQLLAISFAALSGVALVFSRHIRMAFARAVRALRTRFGREADDAPTAAEGDTSTNEVKTDRA